MTVTVYCRDRHEGKRRWEAEGVECVWTPGRDSKSSSTLTFGASSHLHAAMRGNYDAALILNMANGFWLPALRAANVPTALNTDGIEWERGKWGPVAQRVFRLGAAAAARYADVLVADSRAIADIWQAEFGADSVFVPYGAPVITDAKSDRVLALGLRPRAYVLVVARLIPENNVDLILDALEAIQPRVSAVVVGSANYESHLESRLRDLDQRGSLRWLGHVNDQALLSQLWANCGAYVHGHSVGGTNPGLLQALGAGAPTLALDTVFNREVVRDDALLFSPGQLSGKISRLLANPDLQARLSEQGQDIVRARYDWQDVSRGYLDALRLAVNRRAT
jgi:glycosyltransferase involved in cell wall biosynthesis